MKVKNYTIQEIFDKNLLFLIPFYIFTYESEFKAISRDQAKLEKLIAEYQGIRDRLEQLSDTNVIDEYYEKAIMDMSERVIKSIAQKYASIQEGVGSIMGGQIIDFEAKRIRDAALEEGWEKGKEKGREEGREEEKVSSIRNVMTKLNYSIEKAMDFVNIPPAEHEKYALLLKES